MVHIARRSPPGWLALVAGDKRFRANDCCLRALEPGTTYWLSPRMDAHGDPALEFDTGFLWRRAQELLCVDKPLEDLSARPALTFLVGAAGEAVLDGRGRWHATAFAYVKHRVEQAASPLPVSEQDTVLAFIWDILSGERVGMEGGLDRNKVGQWLYSGC